MVFIKAWKEGVDDGEDAIVIRLLSEGVLLLCVVQFFPGKMAPNRDEIKLDMANCVEILEFPLARLLAYLPYPYNTCK